MDRGPNWFDDALEQGGLDARQVVRVASARRPVVERSNPWHDPQGSEEASAVLDVALGEEPAPGRIIYVTDIDEDPIARVQAAVQLGRAATSRGLDVLLVDADIRHVGLSRWLSDRDLDAEGLIDVLQYGASVAGSRRPSQIDGIDVLGIGSYRPDLPGFYGEEDVRSLLSQLRQAAALVFIVGPVRLLDQRFHSLLGGSDAVVLSMHLDEALAAQVGELVAHLARANRPLSGAFLWAGPGDSERFVDEALLERSRVLPRSGGKSPFPGRGPAAPAPGATDAADESTPVTASPDSETGPPDPQVDTPKSGPVSVPVRTERTPKTRRGSRESSPLVRTAFIVIAIGVVGFVAWWALTWRSVEPTRPRVQPPQRSEPVAATETGGEIATDSTLIADSGPGTETSSAGETGTQTGSGTVRTGDEAESSDQPVQTSRDVDGLLSEPVETAPVVADEVPDQPGADPFEAALRRTGDGGWGLHLSSFVSATDAEADRAKLVSRGYSAVVREATIKGKTWYRVVVGYFDSRAAAGNFVGAAQDKFQLDWVGVVRR
jgi:cell division septation protein DedD/Mrp family chromosome partitioning ATPase